MPRSFSSWFSAGRLRLCGSLLVLCAAFVGSLCFGAVLLHPQDLLIFVNNSLHHRETADGFILSLRFWRSFSAVLAGGALALSGSVLQRLLRNPLADPFILGISAGGTLGAALAVFLGLPLLLWGFPVRGICALSGSLATLMLVLFLRRRLGGLQDEYAVPVVGLILNSFFGACLMMIMAFASQRDLSEVYRWMVGSFLSLEGPELLAFGALALVAAWFLLRVSLAVSALSFGDEFATSLGFHARRVRVLALVLVAVLVSIVVSIAGSVGFVGLIVPHIARRFERSSVAAEWRLSIIWGAIVLLVSDILGRTVLAPAELPVGLFTAMLGAPLLGIILWRRSSKVTLVRD